MLPRPSPRRQPSGSNPREQRRASVDRRVIGEKHMWTGASRPTDPEGLLSTLPSIVTALIGYAVGPDGSCGRHSICGRRASALMASGVGVAAIGH